MKCFAVALLPTAAGASCHPAQRVGRTALLRGLLFSCQGAGAHSLADDIPSLLLSGPEAVWHQSH